MTRLRQFCGLLAPLFAGASHSLRLKLLFVVMTDMRRLFCEVDNLGPRRLPF